MKCDPGGIRQADRGRRQYRLRKACCDATKGNPTPPAVWPRLQPYAWGARRSKGNCPILQTDPLPGVPVVLRAKASRTVKKCCLTPIPHPLTISRSRPGFQGEPEGKAFGYDVWVKRMILRAPSRLTKSHSTRERPVLAVVCPRLRSEYRASKVTGTLPLVDEV